MEERIPLSPEEQLRRIGSLAVGLFFSVYLLWVGTSGYGSITLARYQCFLVLAAGWVLAGLRFWPRVQKWQGPKGFLWLLLGLWGFVLLSCLASPYQQVVWLGSKRREGFLTLSAYLALFYMAARFGKMGRRHYQVLALAMLAMDLLMVLQFAGLNPLGLYPEGLTFHHRFLAYGGEYLGTIGNSDMLSAVLAVAIPCLVLCPYGGKTGGLTTAAGAFSFLALLMSEVQSGLVALLVCFVLLLPVCLWKKQHHALLGGAALLAGVWGVYSLLEYDFTEEILTFSLNVSPQFLLGIGACAIFYGLSRGLSGGRKQALAVLGLYGGLVLGSTAFLLLYQGDNAALLTLQQALHGNIPDALGSSRIQIWKEGLNLLGERPILGSGPDTYGLRSEILFTRTTDSGQVRRSVVDAAHNEYLHLAVCCGIPAALCYIGLVWGVIGAGLRKITPVILPLLAAAICWGVQSFFGISQSVSTPLCYLMLGLLYNSLYERREPHGQIG